MKNDHNDKIKKIIGQISCPKGCQCVQQKLNRICRAIDIGRETYLECLEKDIEDCPFSVQFATAKFCKCPLRIYLKKNMKI